MRELQISTFWFHLLSSLPPNSKLFAGAYLLKKYITKLILLTILLLVTGGCGYHFPAVAIYEGEEKTLYMPQWQNRTSKLGIDLTLYKALTHKFQQSEAITITRNKAHADLILAGAIISMELPSIAWDENTVTTDVRVRLTVRYVLKDLKTGKLLWEVPKELWTENFRSTRRGLAAEDEAISAIINDLAERIYLNTLKAIGQDT